MKTAPDQAGFWWMNDPRAYGWEVVRVEIWNNRISIFRTGNRISEHVEPWCCEWIKLETPAQAE